MTATTSSTAHPSTAGRSIGVIAAAIVAAATILGLFIAGITFAALAIAFPIANPSADQDDLPVSVADLALAARFADAWWVFAVLAVASFAGAAYVTVKAITILSPAPRD